MRICSNILLLIFILCFEVSSVKGPGHSDPKKARQGCYFANQKTSPLEKYSRPKSARTKSSCSNKFIDLMLLANNKDGDYLGAPHEMALNIARYQGLFLDENSDLSQWKGTKICTNHWNELSRDFDNTIFRHRKFENNHLMCGFPEKGHKSRASGNLELTYPQSQYLLENRGFLLLPGTPMCKKHHTEMVGMASESSHVSTLDLDTGKYLTRLELPVDEPDNMEIDDEGNAEEVCDDEHADENDPDFKAFISPNPAASAFYKFAKAAGVSRVRCHKPWAKSSPRDQHYRSNGFAILVDIIAAIMEKTKDGQSELKRMMMDVLEGRSPALDRDLVAHEIMLKVAEQYKLATNTHDRIWTLAPFTELFDYHIVAQYIHNLPQRMWDEAKKMAIEKNFFKPEGENVKERYDIAKLVYFINFLTSPHILIGLPYGHSKVTDSHGKVYDVPYAVRQTGIYETIRMYEEYMHQNGLESMLLKRTTMYNILSYLPIKKAHSLTCVDYFQADATNGFIAISRMFDELVADTHLEKEDAAHLKREYDEMKAYLKGNFRLHLKTESLYSDHCILWALSDPNQPEFATEHPNHKHQHRCPQCFAIDEVIRDTKELLKQVSSKPNLSFDAKKKLDGFVHDFNLHVEKIYDLKYHLVRSAYANRVYQRLIERLGENEALAIFDYSMKWESKQYREPQSEFFGKKGQSWHVIYTVANITGKLVSHKMVHVLGEEDQDSSAVVGIAEHYLSQMKIMGITGVHIRSDNAAYYHASAVVASMPDLSSRTGVQVLSQSFSETQAGKSLADTGISVAKRKMRAFVDKLHSVSTAEQMFEALVAPRQLAATSIFLAEITREKSSHTKINKITELSYFEFYEKTSTATAWQFHGIGQGKLIKDLKPIKAKLVVKNGGGKLATPALNTEDRKRIAASHTKMPGQYDEPTFWHLPHELAPMFDVEPNARDDDVVTPNLPNPFNPAGATKQSLFYCPTCSASYIRYSRLLQHIEKGKHFIRPEHIKLLDRVLGLFMRRVEDVLTPVPHSPVSEVLKVFKRTSAPELPQGWAIKHGRKTGRYPEGTKAFIKKKFDEYLRLNKDLRADEAERLMRADQYIDPSEWMTKNQLKNYINTLRVQMPKLRVFRRQAQPEVEDMDDEHFEVEVEPSEEDIVITEEDWHRDLTPTKLKKFFTDVNNPIFPNTPVPPGATEFD